jgi:hypothetical protein
MLQQEQDMKTVRTAMTLAGLRGEIDPQLQHQLARALELEQRALETLEREVQEAKAAGLARATLLARDARTQRARVDTLQRGVYAFRRLQLCSGPMGRRLAGLAP